MCKYCERRKDVKFGWEQPKLPYHNNPSSYNLSGNVLENEKWDATIFDYKTCSPELSLTCPGYFNGEGVGTILIPIKYCPECGRKLGEKEDKIPMFKKLNQTIIRAIHKVFNESVCDFSIWWSDDFETEYEFTTLEELKSLSKEDLDCVKYDWIAFVINGFYSETLKELGIEEDYKTTSHMILLEEIYETVKDELKQKIDKEI